MSKLIFLKYTVKQSPVKEYVANKAAIGGGDDITLWEEIPSKSVSTADS